MSSKSDLIPFLPLNIVACSVDLLELYFVSNSSMMLSRLFSFSFRICFSLFGETGEKSFRFAVRT